jgi:putative redox protein
LTKLYATALLIKDFRIVLDDGRSHSVCIDLPLDTGSDMGPTALELCVMSHAGCYATIFALTAKKMRIPLKELDVRIEAVKTEEAGTITEAKFDITVKADAPADRIERLHNVTLKNCPVGRLFENAGVRMNYSVRTEKK